MKPLTRIGLGSIGLAGTALLTLAVALPAQAIRLVSNRTNLGANDFVNWATLGGNFTAVNNPARTRSLLGNELTLSIPSSPQAPTFFGRINQRGPSDPSSQFWNGNFAPGDPLLWTNSFPGPLTIAFEVPVWAAGTQIQANFLGSFTARIEAFSSDGISLGSFTDDRGMSTTSGDNSALFIGLLSDQPNIARLEFSISNSPQSDFAINQLDLWTPPRPPAPVIPTPALLPGLIAFGVSAWRKQRSQMQENSPVAEREDGD